MPQWNITIDVKDVWENFDKNDVPASVKLVVERIKASGWRNITPYPHTFDQLISDLEASETLDEFNSWWSEVYDLADIDRVWIATF